jgi:hypothetical protein
MLGLFFVVTFGSCLDVAAIQADMPFPIDFNSELGTGAAAAAAAAATGGMCCIWSCCAACRDPNPYICYSLAQLAYTAHM